ncbi:MAG: flagellar biosynthetic protein FliO [Treponema sp.]|nr:flagellar biosynthetic protein FliO [Treponema sp.]
MPECAFPWKAALLLAAGFLIQIPLISAQDAVHETTAMEEAAVIEQADDPLRAAELAMTFGDDAAPAVTAAGPSVWALVRMILVLALAAAAIYGAVYFIKRASKPSANNDPFLKILASSHLGSNRYVHIVSVGSRAWVLGASEGGVNVISEVEDNDVINAMLLEDSRKSAESSQGRFPDFAAILRRLGAPAGMRNPPGADEIRKRRERLKDL